MRKSVTVIALAACLAGCSTARTMRPTMGADPAETGLESSAALGQLSKAYVISNTCTFPLRPSVQGSDKESYRRLGASFANKPHCVEYNPGGTAEDFRKHYLAGVALADQYCSDYFDRIARHSRLRNFGRGTTNDVGTAASAAMGLGRRVRS